MASSKVEKEKAIKEDDLAASISKSMTIDKLKNALTKNRIVYSTAKKKADFIDLYISNGLHKDTNLEELKEKKEEVLATTALNAVNLKEELSIIFIILTIHC